METAAQKSQKWCPEQKHARGGTQDNFVVENLKVFQKPTEKQSDFIQKREIGKL